MKKKNLKTSLEIPVKIYTSEFGVFVGTELVEDVKVALVFHLSYYS